MADARGDGSAQDSLCVGIEHATVEPREIPVGRRHTCNNLKTGKQANTHANITQAGETVRKSHAPNADAGLF
jgi:hypothetical protein